MYVLTKHPGRIFGPDESGNHFLFTGNGYLFHTGDAEMVTTFFKTRRKQEPSPLFKIGRKQDKLEKPERKETNDQKHHI
jgi:hypothetical protein